MIAAVAACGADPAAAEVASMAEFLASLKFPPHGTQCVGTVRYWSSSLNLLVLFAGSLGQGVRPLRSHPSVFTC